MLTYSVESNLAGFNARFREYIEVSKKTPLEAVQKQSAKLGFALSGRLRLLAPAKGSVRSARLADLEAGRGVRVRPSIKGSRSILTAFNASSNLATRGLQFGRSSILRGGKRLNLQAAMVARELALREQGRGYTALIARFAGIERMTPGKRETWLGKYQQTVSEAGLEFNQAGSGSTATMELQWSDAGEAHPGEAMSTPQAQQALAGALQEVEADMKVYIERKQAEAAAKL